MDNRVVGLGACSTGARVSAPSEDISAEQVEFSKELIARLLHVSLLGEDGDPRSVQLSNGYIMDAAVETIFSEEKQAMDVLQESRIYWIETNPVFLYAFGGGVVSMCLFPFLQGFSSDFGSKVSDWLWKQLTDRPDC